MSKPIVNLTFADRLGQLMLDRALSQNALAAELGIAQSSISVWCQGGNLPSQRSLRALADFFGVSAEWLAEGDSGAPAPTPRKARGHRAEPVGLSGAELREWADKLDQAAKLIRDAARQARAKLPRPGGRPMRKNAL